MIHYSIRSTGRWPIITGDFPDNIQAMMNRYSVRNLLDKAAGIGPDTAAYVEALL